MQPAYSRKPHLPRLLSFPAHRNLTTPQDARNNAADSKRKRYEENEEVLTQNRLRNATAIGRFLSAWRNKTPSGAVSEDYSADPKGVPTGYPIAGSNPAALTFSPLRVQDRDKLPRPAAFMADCSRGPGEL